MRLVVLALVTSSLAGCASQSGSAGPVPPRVLATTEAATDGGSNDAAAACAAPTASIRPLKSRPGDLLLVTGEGFMASCNDTGQGRDGAAQDVPVVLEQGRRQWDLGSADAAEDNALRVTVAVPVDAERGRAQVRVGSAQPVRLSILDDHVLRVAPAVSATWVSPDTVALTTGGSSSCPTMWTGLEPLAPQTVEVRARPSGRDICTADHVPSTEEVTLPDGVSTTAPLTLVVHLDDWRSERMTLQPPPPGR